MRRCILPAGISLRLGGPASITICTTLSNSNPLCDATCDSASRKLLYVSLRLPLNLDLVKIKSTVMLVSFESSNPALETSFANAAPSISSRVTFPFP